MLPRLGQAWVLGRLRHPSVLPAGVQLTAVPAEFILAITIDPLVDITAEGTTGEGTTGITDPIGADTATTGPIGDTVTIGPIMAGMTITTTVTTDPTITLAITILTLTMGATGRVATLRFHSSSPRSVSSSISERDADRNEQGESDLHCLDPKRLHEKNDTLACVKGGPKRKWMPASTDLMEP